MSKKKKEKKAETTIENFYDLKVDEVDELVSILKGEGGSPDKEIITDIQQITGEEVKGTSRKAKNFDPYKRDKLAMLPTWLKARAGASLMPSPTKAMRQVLSCFKFSICFTLASGSKSP